MHNLVLICGYSRAEKDENSRTEEEEDQEEQVSVCQSPISVNSHLQCRASSIDLSMPIAELQEAGFSQDDIKSQKYFELFAFIQIISLIFVFLELSS